MIIGKVKLNQDKVKELIQTIKKKKELKELSNEFIISYLREYFQKEQKLFLSLSKELNPKSKEFKQVVKEVRSKLRRVYGLFRVEDETLKRKEFVEDFLTNPQKKELIEKILETHSSTKERLPHYKELYKKLFKITKKPKSIIDLGCGINPFSFPFMDLKNLTYYAYDISEDEIGILEQYFNLLHQLNPLFSGEAHILDALRWTRLLQLEQVDVCFLFKMTDVLDQGKGHKKSEEVIKSIPAKFIIVSVPTLTMSGKRMNHPRKGWIELMCKRLNYDFNIIEFSNELFYVIKKQ